MIDRNTVLNLCQVSSDINEYLMTLYNIPVQIHAKTIVEIGMGVSTFALVAAANETGGTVYGIDICGTDALNRVPDGESIMKKESNFIGISGNSLHVPWEDQIDFLFLDSEHTYDLTKGEISRWFPYVRHDGIIAMHDTGHQSKEKQGAVRALQEFLNTENGHEYKAIHLLDTKLIGMSILMKL